ncbi:hypothetical protein RBB50_003995 [Rhinocladiella similis]
MIALAGGIGLDWKIVKRTPIHRGKDVALTTGLQFSKALTEHYQHMREAAPNSLKDKIMAKIF